MTTDRIGGHVNQNIKIKLNGNASGNDNLLNVHLVVNDNKVALKSLAYFASVGKSNSS